MKQLVLGQKYVQKYINVCWAQQKRIFDVVTQINQIYVVVDTQLKCFN